MVGGAGSKNAMDAIKADDSVLKATIIYPSTQAADGIRLARLLVQGKALADLVEVEVPNRIVLSAPVVTKENVDQYLPTAFASLAVPRTPAPRTSGAGVRIPGARPPTSSPLRHREGDSHHDLDARGHDRLRLHGSRPLAGLASRPAVLRPSGVPRDGPRRRPQSGCRRGRRREVGLGRERHRLARRDRARRHRHHRHRDPGRLARRDRHRRPRGRQARALREAARQHRRRGRGDGGRRREGRREWRLRDGRLHLPPRARGHVRPRPRRRRQDRHRAAGARRATCRTGSSTRPSRSVWRLQKDLAGSGALGDIGAHAIDLAAVHHRHAARPASSGTIETIIKRAPGAREHLRPRRHGRHRARRRSPSTTSPCSPGASTPACSASSRRPGSHRAQERPARRGLRVRRARSPSTSRTSTRSQFYDAHRRAGHRRASPRSS